MPSSGLGPSRCLSNRQIRKMLTLVGANEKDVFYDLGCGAGQLGIIAVNEFHVKSAVGIDSHRGRVKLARANVRRMGLQYKVKIKHGYYQDLNLKDATIVYCGLQELDETLDVLQRKLRRGCRVVTLNMSIVGVLPQKKDFPFYVSSVTFKRTDNIQKWGKEVMFKPVNLNELKDELKADPDYWTDMRGFMKLVIKRFEM